MHKTRLAVLVLATLLAVSPAANAAPAERNRAEQGSAWSALLERLEPFLALGEVQLNRVGLDRQQPGSFPGFVTGQIACHIGSSSQCPHCRFAAGMSESCHAREWNVPFGNTRVPTVGCASM